MDGLKSSVNSAQRCFNTFVSEFDACYHNLALNLGFSDSVLNILYTLTFEGDGCNQSILYKMTGLSKQTVNSAIRRMEKDKLLKLEAGKGRNTLCFLTEKGEKICKEKIVPVIMAENEIFNSWNQKDVDAFLRLNLKYYNALNDAFEKI